MERSWYWRFFLLLGAVLLAVYYSIPSAIYFMAAPEVRRSRVELAKAIPNWLPKKRFNMGIDLQGGLHLVMGVDTEKAIQDRADRVGDELVEQVKEKGKALERVGRTGDGPELEVVLKSADDWDAIKEVFEARKDTWTVASRTGTRIIYKMSDAYEHSLKEDAVAQAIKTLRNRIDKYGVTEPEVRRRGENSIMLQIAGLSAEDQTVIKNDIIGRTAQLEFKIVDDKSQYFSDLGSRPEKPESVKLSAESYEGPGDQIITRPYLEGNDKLALQEYVKKYPPISDRMVGIEEYHPDRHDQKKVLYRTWLLDRKTPITGDSLTDAYPYFDPDQNTWHVSMKFDRHGAVIFEKLTRDNTKRKMAIVLDGIVDSAPIIQGPIPNGNAQITLGGSKTQQEILNDAKSLSIVLKAGALPAPMYQQEERTVGATLGDDAVYKGKMAMLASMIVVFLGMWIYYKAAGVIGTAALSANLLFAFAALAAFNATLTLPGIAGLALTVGMQVDANIIQFERIREELASGKTLRAAVDAGIDRSLSAILDANVTSMIAAIVLYQYGSGPIRGFATTLGIGSFLNTFTAVIVPRLILDYLIRARRYDTISI